MILLPFDKFICREGMSVNIIILNIYITIILKMNILEEYCF